MRGHPSILLVVLLPAVLLSACNAVEDEAPGEPVPIAWTNLDGPARGEILSILASSKGTLFVGTRSALCRSTDQGDGWDCDGAFSSVRAWAEHDLWVWAATAEGVLESRTEGRSWRVILEPDTGGVPFEILVYTWCCKFVGRHSPEGTVLYRSSIGDTWDLLFDGAASAHIRSLMYHKYETVLAAGNSGIFRSTDWGETWTAINRGLLVEGEVPVVHDVIVDSYGRLYAATPSGGVFRSRDGGESWEPTGLSELPVLSLATNSVGHVFAGTVSGVYRLSGDGEPWEMVGLGGYEISALAIDQEETLFAGTEDVMQRSTSTTTVRRP